MTYENIQLFSREGVVKQTEFTEKFYSTKTAYLCSLYSSTITWFKKIHSTFQSVLQSVCGFCDEMSGNSSAEFKNTEPGLTSDDENSQLRFPRIWKMSIELRLLFKQKIFTAYNLLNSEDDSEENGEVLAFGEAEEDDRKTSYLQTFWNIFNANQGVAILAMPYVVKSGGYAAIFSIIAVAIISNFSNKRLVDCLYEYTEKGEKFRVRNSYVEIGEAFAPRYGHHLVNAAQMFEQVSYCTLLLILCGSILESTFPFTSLSQSDWTAIAAIALLPNVLLKSLADVSWVSFITVVIGEVIYLIVLFYGFWHHQRWDVASMPPFALKKFGAAVGIVVVSYSSQPYMPAIEGSMQYPSRFNNVMDVTYIAVTFVKVFFGFIGYLTFTHDTDQVITNNLPEGTLHITVNLLVLFLAVTSYTIPVYTVFDILENISFPCGQIDNPSNAKGKDKLSYIQALVARLCVISFTLLVGVLVPHFGLYMALVGSFTGMCLSFIFPALFHMKICYARMQWYDFFIDSFVSIFGILGAIIGCHFSVLALISVYQKHDL